MVNTDRVERRVAAAVLLVFAILVGVPGAASAAADEFSGTVFNDRNWDGVRDPGEGPLPGVVLEVTKVLEPGEQTEPFQEAQVLATTTSGSDGRYSFQSLPVGKKIVVRPAKEQPLHIDTLGFNGLLSTTFFGQYFLSEEGFGYGSNIRDRHSIDIGASRYHNVNLETWVDTNHDGIAQDAESPPNGYSAELLDSTGATVAMGQSAHDSKVIYLTVNEASTAYAVRAKSGTGEQAIVGFDSDGGADGDIVINRGGGRTPTKYQVTLAAASNFGGVVAGCTVAQPNGWAVDATASSPVAAQVWRLYSAFLLRQPEQQGFDYWLGIRQANNPHTVVAESFALSTEFTNRYGSLTDSQYVQLLYENVLCRQPDTVGYNYWLLALRNGLTRGEAMLYFSEGNEYLNRTGTAFPLLP